jgi:hypothetical protein
MFTRMLAPSATATALLLGVLSQQAAATEEIVVYGTEVVAQIEARQAMFRSEMDEYIRSLNERIKATLQESVKDQTVPKLEVASTEEPVRG